MFNSIRLRLPNVFSASLDRVISCKSTIVFGNQKPCDCDYKCKRLHTSVRRSLPELYQRGGFSITKG